MICEFCKYGADMLTDYKAGKEIKVLDPTTVDTLTSLTEREIYAIIQRAHKRCRGLSHCDCQHADEQGIHVNHYQ